MDSIMQAMSVLTKTGDHRPEKENTCAVITGVQGILNCFGIIGAVFQHTDRMLHAMSYS